MGNSNLTPQQRLSAFVKLGKVLSAPDDVLVNLINSSRQYNAWFTPENVSKAVSSIAAMLNEGELNEWFKNEIKAFNSAGGKTVGLVLAGNIPLVGFHDVLCVLASGNNALIKLSSQDDKLLPYLLGILKNIEPAFGERITYTSRLEDFDAIIATGSNNTSRYFEYYFGKFPNIIRKNRNSVALIAGIETHEQLGKLGDDIFDYFGLGCRNVSKIYIPENFDLARFFEAIENYQPVINHHKYNNNYDYNKSIFLVNGQPHLDNGFMLLKEDQTLTSPLATLYFERYSNLEDVITDLNSKTEQLQCVAAETDLGLPSQVRFGGTQSPRLWDYADNVNTMEFLASLNS